MRDKQDKTDSLTINVENPRAYEPYQHPKQTDSALIKLVFNSMLLAYATALVAQVFILLPLSLPPLDRLPLLVLCFVLLVAGLFWALKKRVNTTILSYTLAIVAGLFLGI
ncbi:hypothetical protein BZZ01_13505 [Nostocales cyanobacterium HT-58-2]|nr:hypothetical protein BZZ01_13505 [Nostocales cyanobacterium HT-58-2]